PSGQRHVANSALLRIILILIAVAVSSTATFATVFAHKNFNQLVTEADQIFIGTVTSTPSRQLPSGPIVTDVTFADPQVLKGPASIGQIALLVLGGTVGTVTMEVEGVPRFEVGVRYLVFSEGNGSVVFPVVGGPQGLFQVNRDPSSGQELVFDAYGKPIPDSVMNEAFLTPPVALIAFVQAIQARLNHP